MLRIFLKKSDQILLDTTPSSSKHVKSYLNTSLRYTFSIFNISSPPKYPKNGKNSNFSKRQFSLKHFPEETIHSLFEMRSANRIVKKPLEPSDEDCCGTGCVPCVFDTYEDKMKKYKVWLAKQNIAEEDGN